MNRTITPFRVTIILDADKSAVAQIERMETLAEDDGTVILSRALPAEPLEFPLSGELLGDLSAQAIARCKELDEQIETLTKDHAEALAAKDAELTEVKTGFAQLEAFRQGMIAKVSTVLQSGDPAQFAALAEEFLTPEQEKERQAKVAKIQELKAQAAALESELETP